MALTIGELATALQAESWGDTDRPVNGAGEPGTTTPDQIALAMAPKYAAGLRKGDIALLAVGMDPEAYGLSAAIFAPRPRLVMAGLTRAFDPGPDLDPGIHPTAVVHDSARIGEGAAIGAFVVIGRDVQIGANARIAEHVSIGRGTVLGDDALILPGARIGHGVTAGDRLIVQPGAVIGGDGFSFVTPQESASKKSAARLVIARTPTSSTGPGSTRLVGSRLVTMSRSAPIPRSIAARSVQPGSDREPSWIALYRSAITW